MIVSSKHETGLLDLDSSSLCLEFTDRIEREVLVVSAIGLDNHDISEGAKNSSCEYLHGSYFKNFESVDFEDLYKPKTKA